MRGRHTPLVHHALASPFDLRFRPPSYDPDPAGTLLSEVSGRAAPNRRNEVTIARLRFGAPGTIGALASHAIEVRALRQGSHFTYRVVDGLGTLYRPFCGVSSLPLTFGELIEMIAESAPLGAERGLLVPVLERVFGFERGRDCRNESAGDRSALVDTVRAFVTAESACYPQLGRFVETQIDEWLAGLGCSPGGPSRVRSAVAPEGSVAGPHAAAIERLVLAWRRSEPPADGTDAALDRARRGIQLRRAIRRHACRHGRLPAGMFEVLPGADGADGADGWSVDIDELTESGELIERVLGEGEPHVGALPGWPEGSAGQVTAYRFGGRFYLSHGCGLDGPFPSLPDLDRYEDFDAFCEEFGERHGTLVAENEGYARMSVYRVFGLFVTADENGYHGPYADFAAAVAHQDIYRIYETTTRIWDVEHGLVFDGGILFRPEVVERYGGIHAADVIRRPA